jgi:hypothetical protein
LGRKQEYPNRARASAEKLSPLRHGARGEAAQMTITREQMDRLVARIDQGDGRTWNLLTE